MQQSRSLRFLPFQLFPKGPRGPVRGSLGLTPLARSFTGFAFDPTEDRKHMGQASDNHGSEQAAKCRVSVAMTCEQFRIARKSIAFLSMARRSGRHRTRWLGVGIERCHWLITKDGFLSRQSLPRAAVASW